MVGMNLATASIFGFDYSTVFIALAIGVTCAVVTQKVMVPKGYSERASFCIGLFLGFIGLIIAYILPPKDGVPTTKSETDNAKALREYKALLDEGAITQAEYEAKKRELLS